MTGSTHKYVRIKTKIKDRIKSGVIVDKLPGERVLAAELGVSYMTVRKAISELVDEGVLHKASTKGTFVNNKSLNSKVTGNIGFLLDEEINEGISSPYYSLLFKSLEEEVARRGYNMLLFSDFNDLDPLKNQKKIDGVIICSFPRIEDKIQAIKKYLPIVLLDNIAADKSIPSVTIDNFNSCNNSVEYLLSLGHRRIGFISGLMDSDICKDRLQGYKNALARFGVQPEKELLFKGDYSFESGERAGKYFASLPHPPTAIMCANDSMAIGAMKVIRESGLRIPQDISIIGFDDILVASMVFPSLTTNAAPIEEMAAKAVEILLAEIEGEHAGFLHVILEAKLVKRGSCTPLIPKPHSSTGN
ncbi:MAG: GntR family transcriptional regulator [Candidatus Cloacimonadaceae bacterium]|nr:GntR family transcriptional regulator [Actinomycetota bacterium]MDZ4181722.1 GntR family transcriptional regulator [Candidatus Cloacimonadaceae bacterium]